MNNNLHYSYGFCCSRNTQLTTYKTNEIITTKALLKAKCFEFSEIDLKIAAVIIEINPAIVINKYVISNNFKKNLPLSLIKKIYLSLSTNSRLLL